QIIHVKTEIILFLERQGHRCSTNKIDHGFIDREPWIGIDDFISFFNQSQNQIEHDGLGAGRDNDPIRINLNAAAAANFGSNGLAKFLQSGGGTIVSVSLV